MKTIVLALLLCSPCWSAQVIRYVDPDESSGTRDGLSYATAYQDLLQWNTAEATNLVTAGNYHTVHCRSSSGTADVNGLTLTGGWITDAASYIEIIQDDAPADGVWDATAYRLAVTNTVALNIAEDVVRVRDMQIEVTTTGSGTGYGIQIGGMGAGCDIHIDSCIIRGVCSGTGTAFGIYMTVDADNDVKVFNTIIYGFVSGADTGHMGVYGTYDIALYNCTIYNCYDGLNRYLNGVWSATNCVVAQCDDDFSASITITYCASDDGDGSNAQDALSGDWDNEFVDANNGDFTLVAGGNCIDTGTDNPSSGLYLDDIIDTTRVSPWDIGAYEYGAADTGAANWWWRRRHD